MEQINKNYHPYFVTDFSYVSHKQKLIRKYGKKFHHLVEEQDDDDEFTSAEDCFFIDIRKSESYKAISIIEAKKYLIANDLEKIQKIKEKMNTNRIDYSYYSIDLDTAASGGDCIITCYDSELDDSANNISLPRLSENLTLKFFT
uniref:Uncharacterized protein n=1 Tax=Dactylella tenuis TaxID=383872 RepID=A0A4Y5MV12_9PEZI|nr:hypothetical protein [Dactylella tenuis]QCW06827.1 hypothetical protein [Dactylella tenuis]